MLKKQEKFKILLLSLPIGSGHTIAAQALAKELEKYNVETKHLNVFEYIPKVLTAIFMQAYLLSLRISPQIYSFLYKWGNKDNKSTFSRDLLNAYIARRAYRDICHWQPDLIIATHAGNGSVVSFERFATQQECNSAKQWFIDSDTKKNGIFIERSNKDNELQITCMQVKSLTK